LKHAGEPLETIDQRVSEEARAEAQRGARRSTSTTTRVHFAFSTPS
jgi:hypothetical protein